VALNSFIPQIWSARLLENLRKILVYAQPGVINRDYEGEIQEKGDTVKIHSIGAVTVANYVKNQDMNPVETLNDAETLLQITQQKYFHFQVDDVDKIQQHPKMMDAAMREAAYALRNVADQYIAGLYTDVAAGNAIGNDQNPIIPAKTNAYEYLVDLSVVLDDNDVPEVGRWVIVPPWFEGLMLKDDRFVKSGTEGGEQRLLNGLIGRAAGFDVLKSNNVPNTNGALYKIIAGHSIAWSYAEQVNQVEAYRPERRFADAVKGLHLYGGKTVRPTALAVLTASKA
jgi:N4-gp56 family major capsid protein